MDTTQAQIYVVREGDTLTAIAARFQVTIAQLVAWNRIRDKNRILVGQRLIVSAPSDQTDGPYQPFPGAEYFQSEPFDPLVEVMAYRLIEEGCSAYPSDPDWQWSESDRKSYSNWQHKLGFKGKDADGTPGKKSWDKLHVPIVLSAD